MEPHTSEGMPIEMWNTRMKAIHALIPATLLAGTVLSGPVEANGTANAWSAISRQDYYIVMNAKGHDKIIKVGGLNARKKAPAAGKATKKVVKTLDVKPRKKPAKTAVADKKPKTASVAPPKPEESEPRKFVRLEPAPMSKVLRSGPREVKNIMSEEALQVGEDSDEEIAAIIREMAPYYGVPIWFALRIADVESGYDPSARGRAGEIGVYQLKCQTARVMGFEGDCFALTDARTNVRWGLKHLARAIALSGGNLRLAASKHNAGLSHKSLVRGYIAKVF